MILRKAWNVKTHVDPQEGIVGLNGVFYLLDEYGDVKNFETQKDAKTFIEDVGGDPEDEYLEYEHSVLWVR